MARNFMERMRGEAAPEGQEDNPTANVEKQESGVDKLKRIETALEEVGNEIDSSIDDLIKDIQAFMVSEQEKSIQAGQVDDVLQELLEQRNIMNQIEQIKESAKRLKLTRNVFDRYR